MICSYAQNTPTGLSVTSNNPIPLCSASSSNSSSSNTTDLNQPCAVEQTPLNCTTLLDKENQRELIALVEGKGITFYQVLPESGNLTKIAIYQSTCRGLFVIGELNDSVLISSKKGDGCKPLGTGEIEFANLTSSVGSNITKVFAESYTKDFSFMDNFLYSNITKMLLVFGASNATSSTTEDLIIDLSSGNLTSPPILFQAAKFPFDLNAAQSVLLVKGETTGNTTSGNTTSSGNQTTSQFKSYVVGPAWNNGPSLTASRQAGQVHPQRALWKIEVWNVTDPKNITQDFSLPLNEPTFLAFSKDGNTLYVSQGERNETINGTSTDKESIPDVLTVINSSDMKNLVMLVNITYQDMKASVSTNTTTSNTTTFAPKITAMKTSEDDLWIGWNTGELFVLDISNTTKPLFKGYIAPLDVSQVESSSGSSGSPRTIVNGVSSICPSRSIKDQAWFTVFDDALLNGALFLGVKATGTA